MEHYEVQNSTNGFFIFADDSSAIGTGKTGLTLTVTLAKSTNTASSVSPAVSEVGSGWYWVVPSSSHRNTVGRNLWQFSASGAVIAGRVERIGAVNPETSAFGANTTAPDNTSITAIKAKTDTLPSTWPTNFATLGINSSGHISRVTLTDTATAVTGLNASNLDVAISTRLDAASYVAPYNTTIASIAVALADIKGTGWDASTDTLENIRDAIISSTVVLNVLPGTDRGIDRGVRGQIIVLLQEEITISRSVVDANGSPVDLRSLTLEFVIEDARGNAVATVADADLSVGGTDHNSYSFTVPAAASAKLGTFEYALNDTGNKANLALGDWIVKRRAVS